jgi:hypothetical protein
MVNSTEQELLATMTLPDDGAVNRTLRTVDETFSGGGSIFFEEGGGYRLRLYISVLVLTAQFAY